MQILKQGTVNNTFFDLNQCNNPLNGLYKI